jgi:hypothetical protein
MQKDDFTRGPLVLMLVCRRFRTMVQADGFDLSCKFAEVPPLLGKIRLEALVHLNVWKGTLCDWRDLDAALAAAAPRLRPSFRLSLPALTPLFPFHQVAPLIALLNRHAAHIQSLTLDCTGLANPKKLTAWLHDSARAPTGLLHPSHAFLPALRSLTLQLPYSTADFPFSEIPPLRDNIESVHTEDMTGGGYGGYYDRPPPPPKLHAGLFSGLTRLRVLDCQSNYPETPSDVVFNANIAGLTQLTKLMLPDITRPLQDPEGWLRRPRTQLLPLLEEARAPAHKTLIAFLPALHHVTRLELACYGVPKDQLRPGLAALTRLRHLTIRDNYGGANIEYYTLPFPTHLEHLSVETMGRDPSLKRTPLSDPPFLVPGAALARLTALTSISIGHQGADLAFEEPPAPLPALREVRYFIKRPIARWPRGVLPLLRRCPNLVELWFSSAWGEGFEYKEPVRGRAATADVVVACEEREARERKPYEAWARGIKLDLSKPVTECGFM